MQQHEERKQTNNTVAYRVKFWHAAENNQRKQHPTTESKQKQTAPLGCYQFVSIVLYAKHSLNTEGMGRKSTCTLHIVGRMHQREQLCFNVPDSCLLGHMQAMPSSQVCPVVSCPCASQASALLPVHVWLEADWRTSLPPAVNTKRDGLWPWPLQSGFQLRPAGPTYFTCITNQTFQKCRSREKYSPIRRNAKNN